MKKLVLTAAVLGFAAMTTTVFAQDENTKEKEKDKKQSQEIIIRKKGDKDSKIVVEMKGDNITINGKPISEFKDDDITINRRNVTVWSGNGNNRLRVTPGEPFSSFNWSGGDSEPHAFLGVTTEDNDDGAKIIEVSKESAAEKAGLKVGDIITKVGDKKVEGQESLYNAVTANKPKDEVSISYKRDGKESSVKATLGESKSDLMAYSFSSPDGFTRSYTAPRKTPRSLSVPKTEVWGDNELREMTPRYYTPGADNYSFGYLLGSNHRLGLKIQDTEDGNGVKVLSVDKDSPAEKAGLKKDDVVTEIGGKKVTNTDEVRDQLMEVQEKSSYNIKAKRNNSEMNFDIKIPKKLKTANL